MEGITKKDIQDLLDTKIDPFAQSVQKEFDVVHSNINGIDKRLGNVEERLGGVEERLDNVENRLGSVEERLGSVESDVSWMKQNSGELFTKLDKFITLYEDQKQELTFLSAQVKRLEARIDEIESK